MPLIKSSSKKAFGHNVAAEMHAGKPQDQSLAIAYSMKRKAAHKMANGGETMDWCKCDVAEGDNPECNIHPTPNEETIEKHEEGGSMKSRRERMMDAFHGKHMDEGGEAYDLSDEFKKRGAEGMSPETKIASAYNQTGKKLSILPKLVEKAGPGPNEEQEDDIMYAKRRAREMTIRHLKDNGQRIKKSEYAEGGEVASGYEPMPEEHEKMNMPAEHEDEDMIDRIIAQKYSKGGMVANGGDDKLDEMADGKPNNFDDLALDDTEGFEYTGANSGDEHGNAQEDEDRHDMIARIMKSRALKDRLPKVR